jgi:hypothetical protein
MIKDAKTIPLRDRETICEMRGNTEGLSREEQFSELKKDVRGAMRGMENRLRQVLDQNSYIIDQNTQIINLLTSIETGARTQGERRSAMLDYVTGAGKETADA